MSTEANKILARRVIEEAWNQQKLEVLDELFTSNFNNHGTTMTNGPAVLKRIFSFWLTAFPDFHYQLDEEIAVDDKVVQRATATGTHLGEFRFPRTGTIAPTGQRFEVQHIHIYTFVNGKIVGHHATRDDLGMLQQLGVIPSPTEAERSTLTQATAATVPAAAAVID